MTTAVRIFINLLLLHMSRAQKPPEDLIHMSVSVLLSVRPQSLISILLLVLSTVLSSVVYLWILRYICIGCCRPVVVSAESECLDRIV